jgi:hypothetical protein
MPPTSQLSYNIAFHWQMPTMVNVRNIMMGLEGESLVISPW